MEMELSKLNDEQMKLLKETSEHIGSIVSILDLFEACRYGSMVFTKLEEVMHWMNSLVSQGTLVVDKASESTKQ